MNPTYAPSPARYLELLDELRVEHDALAAENKSYRAVRDEFQRKTAEHVRELTAMEAAITELDRKHAIMKDAYDSEIARLKAAAPGAANHDPARKIPYQSSLPVAFASRALSTAPASNFGPRIPPPPPQVQGAGRLVGISSLPPPPTQGAPPVIPPAPSAPPRGVPGLQQPTKMLPMSHMAPASGAAGVQPDHFLKKEQQGPVPPAAPPSGPGHVPSVFGTNGVRPGGPGAPGHVNLAIPHQQQQQQQQQQPSDDDWLVSQGHSPNGSVVNMNVTLQNSFSHDSVVCCVRYSWDGQFLATGSNRSAHIFDAATGQSVATFSKDDGGAMDDGTSTDSYVRAVCFSPDGNWLITGAEDHVVKVWDVRNRKVKHRLVGHDTDIYSVDASANGQFIISGSGDKKAKLWSLENGKLLSTLGGEYGPTDGITSVSVSPTSQHVAAGSLDKIVRVWDVDTSRLVRQFEGHRDSVYSVAFSPDGRMLLSGSLDKTLKLWDLAAAQPSSQCRLSFTGHKDFVLSVAFSPSGRWLISGSKDRTVQFWDPRQSTMCLMLQGHKNSVISIAHNPKGMSLATGSGDCRARSWVYTS